MTEDPRDREVSRHTWHDDTPFPRRWAGYVFLKIAVLALAVLLALWYFGVMFR